jgi:hypothetical protein
MGQNDGAPAHDDHRAGLSLRLVPRHFKKREALRSQPVVAVPSAAGLSGCVAASATGPKAMQPNSATHTVRRPSPVADLLVRLVSPWVSVCFVSFQGACSFVPVLKRRFVCDSFSG